MTLLPLIPVTMNPPNQAVFVLEVRYALWPTAQGDRPPEIVKVVCHVEPITDGVVAAEIVRAFGVTRGTVHVCCGTDQRIEPLVHDGKLTVYTYPFREGSNHKSSVPFLIVSVCVVGITVGVPPTVFCCPEIVPVQENELDGAPKAVETAGS